MSNRIGDQSMGYQSGYFVPGSHLEGTELEEDLNGLK